MKVEFDTASISRFFLDKRHIPLVILVASVGFLSAGIMFSDITFAEKCFAWGTEGLLAAGVALCIIQNWDNRRDRY